MSSAKLINKITEKWPVKVLSLAAAIIIAVFYRMNTLDTRFFTAQLRIDSSETLIPANSFATHVRVSLRGEADGIQPILEEDIEVFIDLERYTNEGTYRVPVQIRKRGSALGVEPLEISVLPIEIPLTLEHRVTRNVPVFPVFSGTVADGFELTYQSLIPGSVVVDGPRGILDSHIEFFTETINLDRRYDDFSIMVNIVNDNPLLTLHGSRLLEFRGTVGRIVREEQIEVLRIEPVEEEAVLEEDAREDPEKEDDEE